MGKDPKVQKEKGQKLQRQRGPEIQKGKGPKAQKERGRPEICDEIVISQSWRCYIRVERR